MYNKYEDLQFIHNVHGYVQNMCSTVAEMGDRLATIHMGRKLGGGCASFGGSCIPI